MNKLKLNEDKTEFFVASSKSNLNYTYIYMHHLLMYVEQLLNHQRKYATSELFLIQPCLCPLISLQFLDL